MIKINISMPENCMDCPCLNHENGECQVTGNRDTYTMERPRSCPLTEVEITKPTIQKPYEDCVSRKYLLSIANEDGAYGYVSTHDIINAPSITQQELYKDCISREEVKEIIAQTDITDGNESVFNGRQIISLLNNLPSVTPPKTIPIGVYEQVQWERDVAIERLNELGYGLGEKIKTGRWILDETDNSITCDKCGCLIWANDINNGEAYYCPNCGSYNGGGEK